MDSVYFNLWTKKDMMKIACDQMVTAGYGSYNPSDLVIEAVDAISQIKSISNAKTTLLTQNPNSPVQIVFDGPQFCLGNVPGVDNNSDIDLANVFEPDGFRLSSAENEVFIGLVEVLSPNRNINYEGITDNTNMLFTTYTGTLAQVRIMKDNEFPVVGTSMSLTIPYKHKYAPQGFSFMGFRIKPIS